MQKKLEHSFLGCPAYIIGALRSFSSCRDFLASTESKNEIDLRLHIQHATSVLDATEKFNCYIWAAAIPQLSSAPVKVRKLSKLAESYKIGAQLYGRRVLDALVGDISVQDNLVGRLLSLIHELRDDENLFKCILWPMVVAGLESHQPEGREFIMGCLEKFWLETRCLNVVNTGVILRRLWKREEKECSTPPEWIFKIGQLGADWLLV
jgi:hypothetical protein